MYFLISPAKNLNEKAETLPAQYTQPEMLEQSEILMQDVRPLAPQDIAKLMHVSDKIALLNVERNQVCSPRLPQKTPNKPCIFLMAMCTTA